MKKTTFGEKVKLLLAALAIAVAFVEMCNGYFNLKDKATDNRASITTLALQTTDIENVLHTNDLRISKLETINELNPHFSK